MSLMYKAVAYESALATSEYVAFHRASNDGPDLKKSSFLFGL